MRKVFPVQRGSAVQHRPIGHSRHNLASGGEPGQQRGPLVETPEDLGVGIVDSLRERSAEPLQSTDQRFVASGGDAPVDVDRRVALAPHRVTQHAEPDVDHPNGPGKLDRGSIRLSPGLQTSHC